jgi:hypothetical protein
MKESQFIDDEQIKYIQKVVSFHLKNEEELLEKRSINFNYALKILFTYSPFLFMPIAFGAINAFDKKQFSNRNHFIGIYK